MSHSQNGVIRNRKPNQLLWFFGKRHTEVCRYATHNRRKASESFDLVNGKDRHARFDSSKESVGPEVAIDYADGFQVLQERRSVEQLDALPHVVARSNRDHDGVSPAEPRREERLVKRVVSPLAEHDSAGIVAE